MAEYIWVKMDDSLIPIRSKIETASEDELTLHEIIINKQHEKLKKIKKNGKG
jgi:hypothetical protein